MNKSIGYFSKSVVALCVVALVNTVSAHEEIIYQDTFSRIGHISESSPAPINTPDKQWRDNLASSKKSGLKTGGDALVVDRLDFVGLPITLGDIPEGASLIVSADVAVSQSWIGIGFSGSNNIFDKSVGAFSWIQLQANGQGKACKQSGEFIPINAILKNPQGFISVKIALNFSENQADVSVNEKSIAKFAYKQIPKLNWVFVHGSEGALGSVKNFKVSWVHKEKSPLSLEKAQQLYGFQNTTEETRQLAGKHVYIIADDDPHSSKSMIEWQNAVLGLITKRQGSATRISPVNFCKLDKHQKADAIIVYRRRDLIEAFPGIKRYLQSGGALWLVGLDDYFTPDNKNAESKGLVYLLEGASKTMGRTEVKENTFTISDFAKSEFPFLKNTIPATRCSYISANNSIYRSTFPEWIKVDPILVVQYSARNWVNEPDVFDGIVSEMIQHLRGEYKGARILFSGLPIDEGLFDPKAVWFDSLILANLKILMTPVENFQDEISASQTHSREAPSRSNFFNAKTTPFSSLNFTIPSDGGAPLFWEDMKAAGFNAVQVGIPWISQAADIDNAVDWSQLDAIISKADLNGIAVVIDPYSFYWRSFQWTGEQSVHNAEFTTRYIEVIKRVCLRYKNEKVFVGIFATPKTDYGSFTIDREQAAKNSWKDYLKRKKVSIETVNEQFQKRYKNWDDISLPSEPKGDEFLTSKEWEEYVEFRLEAIQNLLIGTVEAIRAAAPDLPIFLRGSLTDSSVNMAVASRYKNVSAHCECVETTVDTDGHYRGMGLRFGIPVGAENGWPKARGGPLRMAFASYLLGAYNYFVYSFGEPRWARPSLRDFNEVEEVSDILRKEKASPTRSDLAVLVPDTSFFCYTKRPLLPWSMDGKPHIGFLMERIGFPYECISAHFPIWEGIKTIVDDGRNEVFSSRTADQIVSWIKAGGHLVCFPQTGRYILGGGASLSERLGVSFSGGEGQLLKYKINSGQVTVLDKIPNRNEDSKLRGILGEAVGQSGDFEITPNINQNTYTGSGKKYLILADKSPEYVKSFFQESKLEEAEKTLKTTIVEIRPKFKYKSVRSLGRKTAVQERNGTISVSINTTHWIALEFVLQ